MAWLFDAVLDWLARAAVSALTGLFDLLAASVFLSPDVTALPQVADMSRRALVAVNVSFVLAVLVAGVTVMTRETVQVRYGVGELAPRLVIGFVAANFATPLCREAIGLANALTRALTGEDLDGTDAFAQMRAHVVGAGSSLGNGLLALVLGLVIAVLAAALLVTWIVRVAVLIVLVGIAPAALACHALPFTDPAARLWWRTLLGCLAIPVLQAVVLFTAIRVLLTPSANLPALGLPGLGDPTSAMNAFVVLCLLWTTVKIPSLMRRYVTRGGSQPNIAAYLARIVVVQQVTRGLGAKLSRGHGRTGLAPRGADTATTPVPYWRPRMPQPTPANRTTRSTSTAAAAGVGPRVRVPAGVTPETVRLRQERATPPTRPYQPSNTGWPQQAAATQRTAPAGARPTGTGWPATSSRPTPARRPPTAPATSGDRHGR